MTIQSKINNHLSLIIWLEVLYICRASSTDVMCALQINLFLQNKAKSRKVKSNVNNVLTRDYDQMDTWSIRKKQSQTKPNKPKTNPNPKKAEMNVTTCLTMNYEQRTMNDEKKRTQFKPNLSCRSLRRSGNKPNFIPLSKAGSLSFRWSEAKLIFRHKTLTAPYNSLRYRIMFVLLIKDYIFRRFRP